MPFGYRNLHVGHMDIEIPGGAGAHNRSSMTERFRALTVNRVPAQS
jgi:hypothetical protein